MAGYFTSDNTELPEDPAYPRALRIPNAEVRDVYKRQIQHVVCAVRHVLAFRSKFYATVGSPE